MMMSLTACVYITSYYIIIIPYSIKHWREKTLVDLAVDSQSAKVLSANVFFHHDFVSPVDQSANVLTN